MGALSYHMGIWYGLFLLESVKELEFGVMCSVLTRRPVSDWFGTVDPEPPRWLVLGLSCSFVCTGRDEITCGLRDDLLNGATAQPLTCGGPGALSVVWRFLCNSSRSSTCFLFASAFWYISFFWSHFSWLRADRSVCEPLGGASR